MVMEVDVRWPIVNINKINNRWNWQQNKIDPSTISKPCKIKIMTSTRSNNKENLSLEVHLIYERDVEWAIGILPLGKIL
jgi:hypothetical protein